MAVRAAFPGHYTFQHTPFYWHRHFRFFPKLFLYHFCPFFSWDLSYAKEWIVLGCVPRLLRICIAEPGPSPSSAWAFGPQQVNGPGPRIIGPHNSPPKPCCPTSWLERRVLIIPSLYYSSFNSALHQCWRFFVCPGDVPVYETFLCIYLRRAHAVWLSKTCL